MIFEKDLKQRRGETIWELRISPGRESVKGKGRDMHGTSMYQRPEWWEEGSGRAGEVLKISPERTRA